MSIDYEFLVEPTTVMTSYYDYMPGGFAKHPIIISDNEDGSYLTFRAKESSSSQTQNYLSHYDRAGFQQFVGPLNTTSILSDEILHHGTDNLIMTWYDNELGCALTYCNMYDSNPSF